MDRIVGRLKAIEGITGELSSSHSIIGTLAKPSQETQVIRIENKIANQRWRMGNINGGKPWQ